MFRLFILLMSAAFSFSCVHVDADQRKKAAEKKKMQRYSKKLAKKRKNVSYKYSDQFKKSTKTSYIIASALERGQPTLDKASRFLLTTKKWKEAHKLLANILWKLSKQAELSPVQNARLLRSAMLYQQSPYLAQSKLVQGLLSSPNGSANQVALLIAATKPNKYIKATMDLHLTKLLSTGAMRSLANPLIAEVVQANRMFSSYSLMKQSLMASGDESFARAMASLKPRQSSRDFLKYLNLATYEELRQLHLVNVNSMTCSFIFNHLTRFHAPIEDPNFVALFLYSTSRNKMLSSLAEKALEPLVQRHRHYLASLLARMPPNVQISFVDSARHNLNPVKKLFLRDFRRITANEDVHFEVDSLRL